MQTTFKFFLPFLVCLALTLVSSCSKDDAPKVKDDVPKIVDINQHQERRNLVERNSLDVEIRNAEELMASWVFVSEGELPLYQELHNALVDSALVLSMLNDDNDDFDLESNYEKVKDILEQGINVNARLPYGLMWTPLHQAFASAGKSINPKTLSPCIELLLEKGADVFAIDLLGERPMDKFSPLYGGLDSLFTGFDGMEGIFDGLFDGLDENIMQKVEKAKQLRQAESEVKEKRERIQRVMLFAAAKTGNMVVLKCYVEYGRALIEIHEAGILNASRQISSPNRGGGPRGVIDPRSERSVEQSIIADRRMDLYNVKRTVPHVNLAVAGMTPLYFAATNNQLEAARYLVEQGADMQSISEDLRPRVEQFLKEHKLLQKAGG